MKFEKRKDEKKARNRGYRRDKKKDREKENKGKIKKDVTWKAIRQKKERERKIEVTEREEERKICIGCG